MKKLALLATLALLPLGGCATPYGYSPGAYAGYDGSYEAGFQGYERPVTYYGAADVESYRPYGTSVEAYNYGPPPAAYGYPQGGYGYGYGAPGYAPAPAYGPSYYSTYYGAPGGYY